MSNGVHKTIKGRIESGDLRGDEATLLTLSVALEIKESLDGVERGTVVWLLRNRPVQALAAFSLAHYSLETLVQSIPQIKELLKLLL